MVLSVRCTTWHNCTWTKFKNLEVFWNSPEVCCGNKIHNLILNIYDHGTQKCRIARSSLFSDDTILKVNEILTTALLKAPGDFPLSQFKAHCDQWHRTLTNSYKNSELTWAVDTTHMKIYSKYFKQFIIGEPITRASDILPFLKAFLCKSRTHLRFRVLEHPLYFQTKSNWPWFVPIFTISEKDLKVYFETISSKKIS